METKVCSKCGIEKSIEDFPWRNKSKGIKRGYCKECRNQYNKEYRQKARQNVQDIKEKFYCAKCGYNQYVQALDFHHIDPTIKDANISDLTNGCYGTNRILAEIDKCVCLCANCHRVFHFLVKEKGITIEQYLEN